MAYPNKQMALWNHTPKIQTNGNGLHKSSRKRLSWDEPDCVRKVFEDRHKKVQRHMPTPCWEWTGPLCDRGYGRLMIDGRNFKAHRASWVLLNGPITSKDFVCHHCDNPKCVNPKHLFLGTNLDNMRDCKLKGRKLGMRGESNPGAKLTEEDVRYIRNNSSKLSGRQMAKMFSISPMSISEAMRRITWKHID